jgi:hypothetical protein
MGKKTVDLLHTLDIPHVVLEADSLEANVQEALAMMEEDSIPVALILRPGIVV